MLKNVSKVALASTALIVLPGMAHAGTSTATGASTLTVSAECSITGADADLGTFNTNDTWGTVIALNGGWNEVGTYTIGSKGLDYINFGSVTCNNGMPYSLEIWGSQTPYGLIRITVAGKTAYMAPYIKQVGATTAANIGVVPGGGTSVYGGTKLSSAGTGTAQTLLGSAQIDLSPSLGTGTIANDRLAAAGTFTDTLTYTLNF